MPARARPKRRFAGFGFCFVSCFCRAENHSHAAEELKTELPELLEALQQGSAKLALSPELESMLNEAKRDGLALGGDGELEAAGRPWQRW